MENRRNLSRKDITDLLQRLTGTEVKPSLINNWSQGRPIRITPSIPQELRMGSRFDYSATIDAYKFGLAVTLVIVRQVEALAVGQWLELPELLPILALPADKSGTLLLGYGLEWEKKTLPGAARVLKGRYPRIHHIAIESGIKEGLGAHLSMGPWQQDGKLMYTQSVDLGRLKRRIDEIVAVLLAPKGDA